MKTLKELMEIELSKIPYVSFSQIEEFITDDKRSASFISSITDGLQYNVPDDNNALYMVAQVRARHSAISFLLGLSFMKFGKLYENVGTAIDSDGKDINYRLWLMTSLNHDRAYSSERLMDHSLNIKKTYQPYLLDTNYNDETLSPLDNFEMNYPTYYAYSSKTIEAYDAYSRGYHTRRSKINSELERIDHGILGGAILFQEMVKKYRKSNLSDPCELLIIKASGVSIAQHNIYKSPNKEIDKYYESIGCLEQLFSTSDYRITKETPLLLLLSLVDTIECVKRFSKGNNSSSSLETLTVLKAVKADVTAEELTLDFSSLREAILEKRNSDKLLDEFNKHLNAIKTINTWTEVEVDDCENEDIICLKIRS